MGGRQPFTAVAAPAHPRTATGTSTANDYGISLPARRPVSTHHQSAPIKPQPLVAPR